MKSVFKLALVGAALAASSAYADVAAPSGGNSELVLFVRDVSNGNRVYARGLGITLNDVLPAPTSGSPYTGPVQSTNYVLPATIPNDSTLTSFLAGGAAGTSYVWTVMAGDNTPQNVGLGSRRYLTTTQADFGASPGSIPGSQSGASTMSGIQGLFQDLNSAFPDLGPNSIGADGQWGQTGSASEGASNWFGAGINNENAYGSAAKFYVLVTSGSNSLPMRVYQAFDLRLSSLGLESLGGAQVPLPPAVWLFCSALAGMFGVARRRLNPQAAVA